MNITPGEVASVITIIGVVFSFFGVTGIDSQTVSGAVNGLVAVITFIAAVTTWYRHRKLVNSVQNQPPVVPLS